MADDLLITCRTCRHEYRVPERYLGQPIACPHCRAVVQVARPGTPDAGGDPLVGREIGGCRLLRRLGAGAMGCVYEAEQLSLGRRVAVKLLGAKANDDPMLVKRFRREARLAAALRHPNIVGVYDHGEEHGAHYLVMEYVEGDTLAALIREAGRLDWQVAADHVIQVGRALERLAQETIIHRDIKPANILVGRDGVAKVADLGLAKQDHPAYTMSLATLAGTVMGSPAYMAPEQARDSTRVTPAADVYALGATFYHAVTGQPPFTGRNGMEVIKKVMREEPVAPRDLVPELPRGISDLILELMAKDPAARPQDVAAAVAEILDARAAPARVRRPRGRRSRPTARRRGGLLILIVVAVLLAVGAVVLGFVLGRGGG
jgi:serine/threonine-protein kinase